MTSANGWSLTVDGHELVAAWKAPFFVLIRDDSDHGGQPNKPLLIHCESRFDASQYMATAHHATLLNHEFQVIS